MASKENPALGEAGLPNHSALAAEPSDDKLVRPEPQAEPGANERRYGGLTIIGFRDPRLAVGMLGDLGGEP
jgi:hypothetical protein